MEHSDFAQRRQITELYAAMSEGELRKLAEEAWTLTEMARSALKAELARRGLAIPLSESDPAAGDLEMSDLVILRRFRDVQEANLARSVLQSAGIKSSLRDDVTIGIHWGWSNALGWVKLLVSSEDADEAAELLDKVIPFKVQEDT